MTTAIEQYDCILCGDTKNFDEFYSRLGRRHKECKECAREIARDNRRAKREGRSKAPVLPRATGVFKRCGNCKEDKDTSLFHANKSNKDGLHNYCRSCRSELWEAYSAELKKS